MFSISYRNNVRNYIIDMATSDKRLTSAAIVGSFASGHEDRWSDIDLSFGVSEQYPVNEVLEDWTKKIVGEFSATRLFDLPANNLIYRVFILPGCLQVDISLASSSTFTATVENYKLLFGQVVKKPGINSESAEKLFGFTVHHLLHARVCIERGRFWQAEYWISAARDHCLTLSCMKFGLRTPYGRGYDDLPVEVLDIFKNSLVASVEKDELIRCLREVITGLLSTTELVKEMAAMVAPQLVELME
jgi:hypothetical protein